MEEEYDGMPGSAREDMIIVLCEGNYSSAQFENVKKLKVSEAGKIMVYREKEAYRIWKKRQDNDN